MHYLQARGYMVVDRRQRDAEGRLEADFFFHLAGSAFGNGFARIKLALGPGPVVIPGAVDQEDLKLVLFDAPGQGAGRYDGDRLAGMVGLVRDQ